MLGGDATFLLIPDIELAHEQHARAAVLQHVFNGVGGFGRENRNSGAARHPDCQLGHDEMGTVLGQQGNACTGLENFAP
jgi:hypothetical protein